MLSRFLSSKTKGASLINDDKLYPFAKAVAYIKGLKLDPDCGYESLTLSKLLLVKLDPPIYAFTAPLLGLIEIKEASASGI